MGTMLVFNFTWQFVLLLWSFIQLETPQRNSRIQRVLEAELHALYVQAVNII